MDVSYQAPKNKLTNLEFSEKAWEYVGVNNMTIYPEEKAIKIAKVNYRFENPFVIDQDKFVTLEDLAIQDELTVRGIDETIWSVKLQRGMEQ